MPKVSRTSVAHVEDHGPLEERWEDVAETRIQFITFKTDIDAAPLLKGLPDDRCSCPHWGYVFSGRLTFRFADHEEVFEAGDAFYAPAGHAPIAEEGTEYVSFSPAEELAEVSKVMLANARAMMQQA
jgi:hypothetical protein